MPTPEVDYPPPLDRPVQPPPAPAETGGADVAPQQVLLGAGVVAVVAAGTASLTDAGSPAGLLVVTLLTAAATAGSLRAARRGLRSSEEALASAAVVLAAVGAWSAGDGSAAAVLLALLAPVFTVLALIARTTLTWPVAAWSAVQCAVLSGLTGSSLSLSPHSAVVLATAVTGVLVTLVVRRAAAVLALVTTAAWWSTGVVEGSALVWTTESVGTALLPGALMLAAAGGLLALRRRRDLRPLLGPRAAVPVLAGSVAGAAVSGVLQAAGPGGVMASGYLGLVLAAVVGTVASPRPTALLRPAGLATSAVLTGLAVVQLFGSGHWSALAALLAAAAVPAVIVAARQPADRPGALPVAVVCLAAAVLFAEADGSLSPGWAGPLLVGLCVLALAGATALRRHRTEVPLAWTAAAVAVAGLAHLARAGDATGLAAGLAVVGVAFLGHGTVTGRAPSRAGGCVGLVLAAWLAAGSAGVEVPEAYTLPAAVVLWLYSGRRLSTGASWPAWGPGLVVAFTPSTWHAVTEPELTRLVLLLVAATLVATAGARWGVQAPLVVGAVALAAAAVGRLTVYLPLPGLLAVAAAGIVLLLVGAVYEERRERARAAFARVADLR
ncbi:SCO7613 C-terminal domain-containing membrane protein [Modestobacter italicus]|uniref:SCO7613 C-terminal domain-containing membrane protein n=1 Tax=Modestobacter italicus (strain DSM 44449 / CECT 9708 / BC 501) TaxID=2732864 RepID=UPI001C98882A|nr:hypothetical protein [Modestobacter italicus]